MKGICLGFCLIFLAGCQTTQLKVSGPITSENQRSSQFVIPANDLDGLDGVNRKINLKLTAGFPDGDGPFPVVVILHGSGNMKSRDVSLGKRLQSEGIAWLGVYTYDSRGLGPKPYKVRLTQANIVDQVSDAYAALNFAETHPLLDHQRSALTGFSLGGLSTALAATTWAEQFGDVDFKYFLNQYGPCILFSENVKSDVKLDHMWGRFDAQTPENLCREMSDHLVSRGAISKVTFHENAAHGWFSANESESPYSFMHCKVAIDGESTTMISTNPRATNALTGVSIKRPSDLELIKLAYGGCYEDTPYINRPDLQAEDEAVKALSEALK
mgnify:CR=1 FL=1